MQTAVRLAMIQRLTDDTGLNEKAFYTKHDANETPVGAFAARETDEDRFPRTWEGCDTNFANVHGLRRHERDHER